MRRLDDPFATRLWIATQQARLLPDGEQWLSEIREIEQLVAKASRDATTLVDRYLAYVTRSSEGARTMVQSFLEGGSKQQQDLHSELQHVAHYGLLALGPSARDALLRAYEATAPASPERWSVLRTLAELRDPALEPFFRALVTVPDEADQARWGLALLEAGAQEGAGSDQAATPGTIEGWYEHFRDGLHAESYLTRWRAVEALGELGERRAIPELESCLEDENEYVRNAAKEALEKLS